MNRFKKGDRVIAHALMKEHPLCYCGDFKGTVVNDLPDIENIENGMPYRVHIDGDSKEITYPFLADEMKKISSAEEEKEDCTTKQNDVISHPAHYTQGIECMDYIESHKLNYARGNIIKYVTRAGLKDASKEVEDLEKARWYINREIERIKAVKDGD